MTEKWEFVVKEIMLSLDRTNSIKAVNNVKHGRKIVKQMKKKKKKTANSKASP